MTEEEPTGREKIQMVDVSVLKGRKRYFLPVVQKGEKKELVKF